MSQKRQPEDGGSSSQETRKRVPSLRNVVIEATRRQKLLAALEPLLRRVVREEVEEALAKHLPSKNQHCGNQIHPSASRSLQLQFTNKLSLPIFTGTKVEGDESSPINVVLVDALTGQVVCDGLEPSVRVEIVVLEGDFEGGDDENWTFEDFKNNIVREREGKRPLLMGDTFFNLNEGTGVVGEFSFTDNSSWTRSRKFKLGARVADSYLGGIRVREAKTESFVVKDHRGELYKKHYPPLLVDEVWRLEKIGKDGAFHKRLASENINTVKDFLTLLSLDSQRLQNILGTGMSTKMWEVTLDHARTCVLNNQTYVYYSNLQPKTGVVFNVIGELMGVLSERRFISIKELSDSHKADANKLIRTAYEHWEDVVLIDEGASVSSSLNIPAISFPSDSFAHDNMYNSINNMGGISFVQHTDTSPGMISSVLSIGGVRSCDDFAFSHADDLEYRNELDPHHLLSGGPNFLADDHLQYLDLDSTTLQNPNHSLDSQDLDSTTLQNPNHSLDSQADLGTAVSGFLAMSARAAANNKWETLKAVVKWILSIKRIVASKKSRKYEMENFG